MEKRNKIERLKEQLPPARFLERIENLDWNSVTEEERFYLKNFGIYNIKLRPDRWMIRLRIDGGRLEASDALQISRLAGESGATPLLTARSQIELHGLRPEQVYSLWRALTDAGFSTYQTLTDNFRALVTDPLSDCAPDARIDTFPLLEAIRKRFYAWPEWIGTLPRKFNTAIVGRETPSFNPWSNDLLFALARREDAWGFNLYLGGKNSETARSADLFCLPDQTADLFEAVARTYRSHGPRGSRSKTRLFHLIEEVGMKQVREWIFQEYGSQLPPSGELVMQSSTLNRDHLLPIERQSRYGEISISELEKAAWKAKEKSLQLRLTPHQELWLLSSEELRAKSEEPESQTLPIQNPKSKIQNPSNSSSILHPPSTSPGSVTACAGSRYCPLSLWDIKGDLEGLPVERLAKLEISLGFSGCLKGCGRHYHSDLGLIGLRTNLYGETEPAARVFLGALEAPEPAPARMLYYSVPLRMLEQLIHTILDDYERSGEESFESFSRNVLSRFEIETLQLWYILRQLYELPRESFDAFFDGEETMLLKSFESLDGLTLHEELYETIREQSHLLWDNEQVAGSNFIGLTVIVKDFAENCLFYAHSEFDLFRHLKVWIPA
ncbi:hypothetical protein [Nitratifractor sp.]